MTAVRFNASRFALGAAFAGSMCMSLITVAAPPGGDAQLPAPETLQLTGVVRDFKERTVTGGHPDFERQPNLGFGLYSGNIAPLLGPDGKPQFTGSGWLTTSQWRDHAGRNICYALYDPARGDVAGVKGGDSKGGIQSAETFNQWYNDVPGVNMSQPLTLTLNRTPEGNYVFDDKTDPLYSSMGGFFPIDGQLLGNSPGSPHHNFHFTLELHTRFTYKDGESQIFRFIGDDDVWVFIDGRLVIDLGGVHAAKDQTVSLGRLGLTDGEEYDLDFFFAERHRTQSNFRIVTNLQLSSLAIPSVNAVFD
jgi:fibro-slime domain-containing protein